MALVANYDSGSSADESSDHEEDSAMVEITRPIVEKEKDLISDDEDDDRGGQDVGPSVLDETEEDIVEFGTSRSLFAVLPSLSGAKSEAVTEGKSNFVDDKEDLSSIPAASASERAAVPLKPRIAGAGVKRKGPVRIVLPSLSQLAKDGDEDDVAGVSSPKKLRPASGGNKTALLSMLPCPKNDISTLGKAASSPSLSATSKAKTMMVPDSVARRRSGAAPKPAAAKREVAPLKKDDSDSEDSGDDEPSSFFTLETPAAGTTEPLATSSSVSLPQVKANPAAVAPADRPLAFKGREQFDHVPVPEEEPVVGPSKPVHSQGHSYPEAEDLMANSQALSRLAGKTAMRNKEEFNVVDIKSSDIAADTREWLTKALTEDDDNKPGPRNTIKGQTKRKHQITYLAAVAKENEHKLKQQWAQNAATKKAAGTKYGFF